MCCTHERKFNLERKNGYSPFSIISCGTGRSPGHRDTTKNSSKGQTPESMLEFHVLVQLVSNSLRKLFCFLCISHPSPGHVSSLLLSRLEAQGKPQALLVMPELKVQQVGVGEGRDQQAQLSLPIFTSSHRTTLSLISKMG